MKDIIVKENPRLSKRDLDDFLKNRKNQDIADTFLDTVKHHRYLRFLRDHYRRDVPLSKLHKTLSKFPVRTIFTTNYDKLLEVTFRNNKGNDPAVVIFPEQLGYIDDSEVRIIKLHGDIDHPSSLVLTRRDYSEYHSTHRDFINLVESSIINYTVLFVGFGLKDSNFERIHDDARNAYKATKRQAYAVMTGTTQLERILLERGGLTILPVPIHSQVNSYLIKILAAI